MKPTETRALERVAGVLRARKQRKITDASALIDIERIVREEQTNAARRKGAA